MSPDRPPEGKPRKSDRYPSVTVSLSQDEKDVIDATAAAIGIKPTTVAGRFLTMGVRATRLAAAKDRLGVDPDAAAFIRMGEAKAAEEVVTEVLKIVKEQFERFAQFDPDRAISWAIDAARYFNDRARIVDQSPYFHEPVAEEEG